MHLKIHLWKLKVSLNQLEQVLLAGVQILLDGISPKDSGIQSKYCWVLQDSITVLPSSAAKTAVVFTVAPGKQKFGWMNRLFMIKCILYLPKQICLKAMVSILIDTDLTHMQIIDKMSTELMVYYSHAFMEDLHRSGQHLMTLMCTFQTLKFGPMVLSNALRVPCHTNEVGNRWILWWLLFKTSVVTVSPNTRTWIDIGWMLRVEKAILQYPVDCHCESLHILYASLSHV